MSELSQGAEEFAAGLMVRGGWTLLARDFRAGPGEVDIIARREDLLVFVEVKLASEGSATMAPEKIDRRKQARITGAASIWLLENPHDGFCRFDVVIVRGLPGSYRAEWLEDAFRASGRFTV